MGQDKAALPFRGRPLLDHMIGLLQSSGCEDVFVSGSRAGYKCIPDSTPHQGPAAAMRHVLKELVSHQGVLFVPVDMPLLTESLLRQLLRQQKGAFFEGWPLPAYIANPCPPSSAVAVHKFLAEIGISPVPRPDDAEEAFINLNTPTEWKKVAEK